MKKRGILIVLLMLYILPVVSATQTDMGNYPIGACVELIQLCGDCTFNNITSIVYPKNDTAPFTKIILDAEMTKRGTEYNYTHCFPNVTGQYTVNGFGDLGGEDTVWAYIITLTPDGDVPSPAKLIFHYGSIFILFCFFVLTLIGIFKIEDYKGMFALYWVAHVLFIAITFMLWNGASNLLTSAPFVSGFFRIAFFVSIIAVLPMVLLSMSWIFYMHLTCEEIKSMMERGMDEDEACSRVKNRRRGK